MEDQSKTRRTKRKWKVVKLPSTAYLLSKSKRQKVPTALEKFALQSNFKKAVQGGLPGLGKKK